MQKSHFAPKLYLIDSFALAFRMYYAFAKSPLMNGAGQNVALAHGYWGAILRLLAAHKPSHFAIVRDMGAPTFRHQLYPEYKANRKSWAGNRRPPLKTWLPRCLCSRS